MKRKVLLFFTCLLFASFTAYFGNALLKVYVQEAAEVEMVTIPVAAKDIGKYEVLTEQNMKEIQVPKNSVQDLSMIQNPSMLLNKMTLVDVPANSPFLSTIVFDPKETTPLNLRPSERAVTIEYVETDGQGGTLEVGMKVDIIWTYQNNDNTYASVVFQDMEVLTVGEKSTDNEGNQANTITLKMSLTEAQKLTLMSETGKIKLVLRPPGAAIYTSGIKEVNFKNVNQEGNKIGEN